MRVAIFDFDGTLYKKETFQLLMNHLKNHPTSKAKYRKFFWSILPRYIGQKLKVYPEQRMRERSMQLYIKALENLSQEQFNLYFKEIADLMTKDFNPTVVSRFKTHVEDHLYVMLVSGAYTNLIQAATEGLEFDKIIGTDVPLNEEGVDKNKQIYHIQGTRKNEMINKALDGKDIDWANSYAYGDSYSDLSVLKLVGNPVAVNPEQRLHMIAEENGWEII